MLNKKSVQPLFTQLEALLRRQIEDGTLAPGSALPSEPELAAQYQISRMTARRALNALVRDGLLVRHPGKGTFVAAGKMPLVANTLASFSRTMAALGFRVSSRVIALELVTPPPSIARELACSPNEQVVHLRRIRSVEDEPVALMSAYMGADYHEALAHADLSRQSLSSVMEVATGVKLVRSTDYAEATLATDEEAELLHIRVGAPVLLLRGIVYAVDGQPARSSKVICRGDRFRLNLADTQVKLPASTDQPSEDWLALHFSMAE